MTCSGGRALAGAALAAGAALVACNFYVPDELSHVDDVPVETGAQPAECAVARVERLVDGVEPDVAADGSTVAFARLVDDSYEVLLVDADGGNERCLTCAGVPPELAGKHKGNPEWDADGRFLVFTAENERGDHTVVNGPGVAKDNDLWAVELATGAYTRLTRVPEDAAIQWPWFARDGQSFVWSQRYEPGVLWEEGNEFGRWRIEIADFAVAAGGAPGFTRVEERQPAGPLPYYEPHDFWPLDRSRMLMSANLEPGSSQAVLDVYAWDMATGAIENLTRSPFIHDEMAVYAPSGHRIALMSGPFAGVATLGYKADLYLMDADGGNFARLTRFNDAADPSWPGGPSQLAQAAWTPDGTAIVFGLWVHSPTPYSEGRLYRLTFAGACGLI